MNYELLDRILFAKVEQGRYGFHSNPAEKPLELENVLNRITELGIKEEDLITSCSINNQNCSWSKVLTPDGLCYAFNLIDSQEMFQQNM